MINLLEDNLVFDFEQLNYCEDRPIVATASEHLVA